MFKEKKWSNRIQLILLVVIFLAPLVGAYAYYAFVTRDALLTGDSRGYSTVNKGEFYSKPQDLADINFVISDAYGNKEEKTFNEFESHWYLVVVADKECNEICEANLKKIAYVRVVHARYTGRIISTLAHQGLATERTDELAKEFGLTAISANNDDSFQQWLTPFYKARNQEAFDGDRIYMIDPLKKLMMSYPADASPLDIYEDMKRLLKLSRVG